jgi:hypothetical protein
LNGTFHRLWKNRNSSVIPIVAETLEQEGELLFGYEKDKRGGGFEIYLRRTMADVKEKVHLLGSYCTPT